MGPHPAIKGLTMQNEERIEFALQGRPYIEMIRLLKVVGIVRSGAVAKLAVEAGEVLRNGAPESRKRAKIRPGETISYGRWSIVVAP